MAATLLTAPATPAFLMPAGAVGTTARIKSTRTNGGTYKVCTGNESARTGGKAHSALLNCSPNDRRTSVRPRPFPRHQPSGTYPAGCCRLRYRCGHSTVLLSSPASTWKGRGRTLRSPPCRSPIGPLYRRPSWTTRGADDRWGECVPGCAGVRACTARGEPRWVGLARIRRGRGGQLIRHRVPEQMRSSALPRGPRLSCAGAASPPRTRPL